MSETKILLTRLAHMFFQKLILPIEMRLLSEYNFVRNCSYWCVSYFEGNFCNILTEITKNFTVGFLVLTKMPKFKKWNFRVPPSFYLQSKKVTVCKNVLALLLFGAGFKRLIIKNFWSAYRGRALASVLACEVL